MDTVRYTKALELIQSLTLPDVIDLNKPSLWIAIASITFNPVFWNIAARLEYRNHWITRLFGGAYAGCYALAVTIFSLGIFRDFLYERALAEQPKLHEVAALLYPELKIAAGILAGFGSILVVTSMYALGVTGTYLGDYFGILMKERVTGFPFNVNDNPMYNGSTLVFLGTALWHASPVGVFTSLFVFVLYRVALLFEEPFTAMIYSNAAKDAAKKSQ
ncbi:methylene-fatty-acyl-phospholipid synthase [Ramicandelaber brevisporus]|nr:methylene-fatty-acyl-phospholipid synthase [Ramicandelaber brevisporus]